MFLFSEKFNIWLKKSILGSRPSSKDQYDGAPKSRQQKRSKCRYKPCEWSHYLHTFDLIKVSYSGCIANRGQIRLPVHSTLILFTRCFIFLENNKQLQQLHMCNKNSIPYKGKLQSHFLNWYFNKNTICSYWNFMISTDKKAQIW